MSMHICIDPGHGGSNIGAVNGPYFENEMNLELAFVLSRAAKRAGHAVTMTRMKEKSISNHNRAKLANDVNADVFISLHHNSYKSITANGFEVLHYYKSNKGTALATLICEKVCSRIKLNNRGPKPRKRSGRGGVVLADTHMPAVLIEAGFISSPIDLGAALIHSKRTNFYRIIAKSVLEAINEVL